MAFTRAQVDAAKDALGLHRHLTHSFTITPTHVYVEAIEIIDGQPDIQNGAVTHRTEMTEIEEDAP